jgi:hypothetical protein
MNTTSIIVFVLRALLGSHNSIGAKISGTVVRALLIGSGAATTAITDDSLAFVAGIIATALGALLGVLNKVWERYEDQIIAKLDAWLAKPPAVPPASKAAALLLLGCLLLAGCRSVTVQVPPGAGPVNVWVDQSAQPSVPVNLLTGMDSNAWKAISNGATDAMGIGAAGQVLGGAAKGVSTVEAIKASK